jgi:signal transduction histidine kinase
MNAQFFRVLMPIQFCKCAIVPSHSSSLIGRGLGRLSIRQKICLGYVVSLGIAVSSTIAGLVVGEHYHNQADTQLVLVQHERQQLNELRSTILDFRPVQEYSASLTRPTVSRQVRLKGRERIAKVMSLLAGVRSSLPTSTIASLPLTMQTYDGTFERMARRYEDILRSIDRSEQQSPMSPETVSALRQQLSNLSSSAEFAQLVAFANALKASVGKAEYQEAEAQEALRRTETLRTQIIIASLGVSVAIAGWLAVNISRAIARPLQSVTEVAQKVTQESNFDLQAPVLTADETGVLATALNQLIQRVNTLLKEQQKEALRHVQTEKLSSLGQMVAGVAHEINNPINFICGNLEPIETYFDDLLSLLELYESGAADLTIQNHAEEIDLEFVKQDLPKVLQSLKVGSERLRELVTSLKNFSRLDGAEMVEIDLHTCLDSALLILQNRLKQGITVTCNYGDLPTIDGYSGALYQVFMNLLCNAIDALEESQIPSPQITITTRVVDEEDVVVTIADNGTGISSENLSQIFESFFTTKPLGVGTGLGLSITHQIVVEQHSGSITCQSEEGKGTEFIIKLPMNQQGSRALD